MSFVIKIFIRLFISLAGLCQIGCSTNAIKENTCPLPPPSLGKFEITQQLHIKKKDYVPFFGEQRLFSGPRAKLPWHMFEPNKHHFSGKIPLIVSLHGGYGSEVENGNIMVDGAPYILGAKSGLLTAANQKKLPAFILMPHCDKKRGCHWSLGHEWSSNGGAHYLLKDKPSPASEALLALIDQLLIDYPIDKKRIYLTGLSMGGGGTWELIQRRPDLFAAAVPVAGHTPALEFLEQSIKHQIPIWAISGSEDTINSHLDTDAAVEYISKRGGCAWVGKFKGLKHGNELWAGSYSNPELWPWLFKQSK